MKTAMQYTKKPVTISAIQWTGDNLREVICFTDGPPDVRHDFAAMKWEEYNDLVARYGLKIFTLEGKMSADIGDWIIKGVKGEHYPCKPDVFDMTYSAALAATEPDTDRPRNNEDDTHDSRLTRIRDSGDARLIDDVRNGRISISAAVKQVTSQSADQVRDARNMSFDTWWTMKAIEFMKNPFISRREAAQAAWDARPPAPAATESAEKLDPVVEAVRAALLQRSQFGIKKYGDTLQNKDYSERDILQHAIEEVMDLSNYLMARIMKIDSLATSSAAKGAA